jgi:hypothetical protein
MAQTFVDLCRMPMRGPRTAPLRSEHVPRNDSAIITELVTSLMKCTMANDHVRVLKTVRFVAISVIALLLAGILTLMVLARGTGEDITGIVAPALLTTVVAGVVAFAAAVLQRRTQRGVVP